jgi:peptide deformylase
MQIVVPDAYKHLYVTDEERPVVKIPSPILRGKALPVDKVAQKTQILLDRMAKVLKQANGIGLAAPQVGRLSRVILIAPEDMKPTALINPVIVRTEGEDTAQEGCLSIPGLYGDVVRARYVEVEALDRRGRPLTFELEGLPARVVQHEIDHLDGILFIDKVIPETLHWQDPDGLAE